MYGSATSAICTADRTRVAKPKVSRASCNANALMTVPNIPIVSDVVRSIPASSPVAPRQMFPPPTMIASSRSRSLFACATSLARRSTVTASIVSSEAAEAKASPDILRTTRFSLAITAPARTQRQRGRMKQARHPRGSERLISCRPWQRLARGGRVL